MGDGKGQSGQVTRKEEGRENRERRNWDAGTARAWSPVRREKEARGTNRHRDLSCTSDGKGQAGQVWKKGERRQTDRGGRKDAQPGWSL